MSKRRKKRTTWGVSRITDPRFPGLTLRVTELKTGGNLYLVQMVDGKQQMTSLKIKRADLGEGDGEQERQARVLALNAMESAAKGLARAPDEGSPAEPASGEVLTLGMLADQYEAQGLHGRSAKYREEQPKKVRRVAEFLGVEKEARSLSRTDVERFSAYRRDEDKVAQGTIASDLHALKIALNWAADHKLGNGEPLLPVNPLVRLRVSKERQPKRPVANPERYEAVKAVAHKLPASFGLALDLAWETGHRIGAILALKWEHIITDPALALAAARELKPRAPWTLELFAFGGIRWYAGRRSDNKVHEHVTPMTEAALAALAALEASRARSDISPPLIFPSPKRPDRPLGYHVIKNWLKRAEKLAKVPHIKGGGFHAYRRGWATARKHLSDADVALLGGWEDTPTMRSSYQQPDTGSLLAVRDATSRVA